jgi:hypothetical protein
LHAAIGLKSSPKLLGLLHPTSCRAAICR